MTSIPTNIDDKYTNKWMKTSTFSSHVEGYICAIQEEEIFTRALGLKRKKESTVNPNCRLCGSTKETIQHIIASCPRLSASMHLPVRHNKVAYVVYQYLVDKHNDILHGIPEVYTNNEIEIWWDVQITTNNRLPHNKPDILLWKKPDKKCYVIDIIVGLDVNLTKNIKKKQDNYLLLATELKRIYSDYDFEVIPIVIGAAGLITKHVHQILTKLKIDNIEECILKCQSNALIGTMNIVKSFMKM